MQKSPHGTSQARHGTSRTPHGKQPHRSSRAELREGQLLAAAQVDVAGCYDVAVIGGGAAGLVAATAAAEGGARVVVLDRSLECGRTILATGNGRCNFSNVGLEASRYNDPDFVAAVFGADPLADILGFFGDCGLRWDPEGDRLYPLSRQASSVRSVLIARARAAGVTLAAAREVERVERSVGPAGPSARCGFTVAYRELFSAESDMSGGGAASLHATCVIVATGGGTCRALDALGLASTPTRPVLCPVACEDSPLAALDGRRAHVRVQLSKGGPPVWQERGEVLLRSYGLSGIVSFDLSRHAGAGDLVEIDLVPDLAEAELRAMIDPTACGDFVEGHLDGTLDPVIAHTLEVLARERWTLPGSSRHAGDSRGDDGPHRDGSLRHDAGLAGPRPNAPQSDADALLALVKALPFRVVGNCEERGAQVTRGGLQNDQFSAESMESAQVPGLFACGEALDVDAGCGGFNLSWAWKSGLVAGAAAGMAASRATAMSGTAADDADVAAAPAPNPDATPSHPQG